MRLLILLASVWAIAHAKPEMYRESEDFQYSRSSSDEGSKSGFYGAQRGNMGGNYERAHNMDGLAQHQMSTAVRQVDGELGEGTKEKSGSVYTSANSRGIFGSGHYDLSNLKGRHFDESGFSDSLSHSSLTSQNAGNRGFMHNSDYNTGFTKSSRLNTGYASADYSADHSTDYTQNKIVENAQQANNQYSYGNQAAVGSDYKYYSHGGSRAQSQYDGNLHIAHDSNVRRVTDTPVRVVMRPGSIVTVPVSAQTYDASSSSVKGASYGHNAINSEAEELSNGGSTIYVKPNTVYYNKPKHYESSYSYRKEWEKHNTQPVASISTENPFSKDSEIYDSRLLQNAKNQFSGTDFSSAHTGSSNVAHSSNANIVHRNSANIAQSNGFSTKSASAHQSQYSYDSQRQNAAAAAHSNAYSSGTHNAGAAIDGNDLVENIDSKPKSYQSSYSYHKSWERRGDPYVIKPVGGDSPLQTSQKLISASANQDAYSSHNYGALYNNQAHQRLTQSVIDCDENDHIRVARSAYSHYYPQQQQYENIEDLGQQTQNQWDNFQELGQQSQKLEDFGQQSQRLEDFGQQSQNLEDFGQQSQKLEDFGQQSQKLEDFGQQSQKLEDFGQQSQKLEDFGQQSQKLENFGQQSQKLEDFGQQAVLEQQAQNEWGKFEQFNEHSSSTTQQKTQEQNMDVIPDFNQNQVTEEQKLNSFWDQQNFNTQEILQNTDKTQNFDFQKVDEKQLQNQLEIQKKLIGTMYNILSNHKSNEQITDTELHHPLNSYTNPFQNHHNINYNDGANQYTGFSQYSHQNSNSGMNESWQKQYQNRENSNNNAQSLSPLQSIWNKLDNLDSQGGLNMTEKENEENSYLQAQSQDWSHSNWEQFHVNHNNNMFNNFQTPKEDTSVYPQILKTTTTNITFSPITENAATTLKPRENTRPINPIDVGRGDIDADEIPVSNYENDQTNFYIPKPNRHYKTPEEIESLSMTILPKATTQGTTTFSQLFNNKNTDNENNTLNTPKQFSTTVKTMEHEQVENDKHQKIDTGLTHSLKETNNQKEIWSGDEQKNIDSAHGVELFPKDIDQQHTDELFDFKNSYKLEHQTQDYWKTSEMQENMDQQFEDFGQQSQDTFDLGQHSQNFWEPRNKAEESEIRVENFANNGNQHNDEQLEQLSRRSDKLESQDMLKFKHHNSREVIAQKKVEYQKQQLPTNNQQLKSFIDINKPVDQQPNEKLMPQPLPKRPDLTPTPEEATEKSGFWKSVGSKFTSAKDTVVSWFKKS